eukprot:COSAG02_NODE_31439_length_533_cov_1.163594_1_plen_48_part_00
MAYARYEYDNDENKLILRTDRAHIPTSMFDVIDHTLTSANNQITPGG